MQLYGLLIFANPPGAPAVPLTTAWELGSFGWLQRSTVQDMMGFMAKTVAERTKPTQRQSVQENSYVAHVHSRPASDGISGVLISDSEYPVRVAFSLLNKTLDEFVIKVPRSQWESRVSAITTGSATAPPKGEALLGVSAFPQAVDYVKRYQDPRQADTIMKVQQELDETKIVLHKTIDSVLQRGEDLDNLVAKSGSLSEQSKMFYKTAKKLDGGLAAMRSSTDDVMVPASTSEHASGPHFASDHLRSRPAHDYRDEEDSQSEDEEEHGRGHGDSHHHYYSGTHPLLQEGQPFLPSGPSGDRSASPAGKLNGRRTPLKWSEVLWVLATSLLIAVLAYSSQIFVIWPYYRKTDTFTLAQLLTLLLPFNASILVLFYNYYLCVTTNPGDVPRGWEPDWSALDLDPHPHPHPAAAIRAADTNGRGAATLELKSYAHKPRYCRSCSSYKPPRSHHCKTCGKCVLRMDHHCPWVANCVGFHNHAHFLRFLFAVDVSCTWHLAMLSLRVLDRWNTYGYWREPSGGEVLALVLNYALCIPVLLLVGMFSLYHFYCLAINQTTIESWEKDKVATLIRRGKVRKVRYPYNVSVRSNVGAVLGRNPLLWCVPQRMQGDGLVYEVADGIDPSAQYRWPPKDPARQRAAPSLFPGASAEPSVSPFTYGTGFNPSLVPTSSTLRRRGAGPLANGASQDGHGSSRSEDGTSVSSGSDEDVPLYRGEGAWGVARREEEGELQRWYDDDDDDGEDEDEEEGEDGDGGDGRGRVRVRRGSEGYEVRPAVDRWAVPQPEGREYYERVRLPSEVVAARLIG